MIEQAERNQLRTLYNQNLQNFERIKHSIKDVGLHGPFLCSPKENYFEAKTKILIVGQETKGWPNLDIGIEGLMDTYRKFNLGENYTASPFWSFIRKLELHFDLPKYSCAWTNINKYDINEGRPQGKYELEISTVDSLLISEIEILNPDVCIFLVGPDFNFRLKKTFQDIEFEEIHSWKRRQFVKLKHPRLPERSYRTYHPKYLRLSKMEGPVLKHISGVSY